MGSWSFFLNQMVLTSDKYYKTRYTHSSYLIMSRTFIEGGACSSRVREATIHRGREEATICREMGGTICRGREGGTIRGVHRAVTVMAVFQSMKEAHGTARHNTVP